MGKIEFFGVCVFLLGFIGLLVSTFVWIISEDLSGKICIPSVIVIATGISIMLLS